MRIVEKSQLMSAPEIDRTLQRLAHEIVEKSGGTKNLALIGIVRRGVPLAQRIAQAMRGIDGVNVPVGVLDITLYRDDLSKVAPQAGPPDPESTPLKSRHNQKSYAGLCFEKKKKHTTNTY